DRAGLTETAIRHCRWSTGTALLYLTAEAEVVGGGGDGLVVDGELADIEEREGGTSAVEDGGVGPGRFEGGTPAEGGGAGVEGGGAGMGGVQRAGLGLGGLALAGGDLRGAEALADEDARVVEVEDLGGVGQLDGGQGQRQTAAPEQRGLQALGAEARELLDNG